MSPSGKAPGFGPGIRGFESLHPSQEKRRASARLFSLSRDCDLIPRIFCLVKAGGFGVAQCGGISLLILQTSEEAKRYPSTPAIELMLQKTSSEVFCLLQ